MDPQTTLTMLRRNSLSITGQAHLICFFTITYYQIVRSRSCPLIDNNNWPISARISAVILQLRKSSLLDYATKYVAFTV